VRVEIKDLYKVSVYLLPVRESAAETIIAFFEPLGTQGLTKKKLYVQPIEYLVGAYGFLKNEERKQYYLNVYRNYAGEIRKSYYLDGLLAKTQ